MTTTVWDLLHFPTAPPPVPRNDRPSTAKKSWTEELHTFNMRRVTSYQPTLRSVDEFLGPSLDLVQRQPSDIDNVGVHIRAYPPNVARLEDIQSEADVDRFFYQKIEPAFRLAFSEQPFLLPRSQIGPTGPTNSTVTVDYQLTWPGQNPLLERAAMIGELKRPHVINAEEWAGYQDPGLKTQRLQREMRGYAYHYDCPQVFVFDSVNLLILQFKARNRNEILRRDCAIDCCLIPVESIIPDQSTIQYGLYRLAWRGWMRLSATLVDGGQGIRTIRPVTIDNITREYEGWSGRPLWQYEPGRYSFEHPNGWRREFILDQRNRRYGRWVWVFPDGRVVSDTEVCLQ